MAESKFRRALYILGAREKDRTPAYGEIGRCLQPILSCPRINGLEQNPVGFENIGIRKEADRSETPKSRIDTRYERSMLKTP